MSMQKLLIALPSFLAAALMFLCVVLNFVKERRARKLFMRETDGTRRQWLDLPPREQRRWAQH